MTLYHFTQIMKSLLYNYIIEETQQLDVRTMKKINIPAYLPMLHWINNREKYIELKIELNDAQEAIKFLSGYRLGWL